MTEPRIGSHQTKVRLACENLSDQGPDLGGGHKQSPRSITSLPFHPVGYGRLQNCLAPTLLQLTSLGLEKIEFFTLFLPQLVMEADVSVFVSQRGAEAVFVEFLSAEFTGYSDYWTLPGLKLCHTFNASPFQAQISIQIKFPGIALNQLRQRICWNRVHGLPVNLNHELRDGTFALKIELSTVVEGP